MQATDVPPVTALGTGRIHWVNQYAVTPAQPGGTRHHEMAAALGVRGYDVRVVASDLNLTSRKYSQRDGHRDHRAISQNVDGVAFVWLPAGDYDRNNWRRALSMVVFAWFVWLHLLRNVNRGDVVIGSSPQLLAVGAARLAALIRGAPFVFEVRDLWPESMTGVNGRGGVVTFGLRVVADLLYRTSPAIVILAEGNRAPIVARGGRDNRIFFVPNGVDVATFTGDLAQVPAGLEWIETTPTFVYPGAHGPANGLELVLQAAHELQRRGRHEIRILLIGDGSLKSELQQEAQRLQLDNVVFHDPVAKQAIPSILRRCAGGLMVLKDVELFRSGVSPNKLFDYLACDLPVLTNVPGDVSLTVTRADAGVVVPCGDAGALADGMIEIVDAGMRMGSGLTYVRQHHDRRMLADRLAQVIDGVIR